MFRDQDLVRPRPALLAVAVLLVLAMPSILAQTPGDGILRDFQPNSDFQLEIDGKLVDGAQIYFSQPARGYLLMAPELASPLLVDIPSRQVQKVHLMKVRRRSDGAVDLLADAVLNPISEFQVEGQSVSFRLEDKAAKLVPKPALVGPSTAAQLVEHSPDYVMKAENYQPLAADVKVLQEQDRAVTLKIFFGTWCSVCSRQVPKILRLAKELEDSKIQIEYYGLPRPPWKREEHPEIDRYEIEGVPTGVLFLDGRKLTLFSGEDFTKPEVALRRHLGL